MTTKVITALTSLLMLACLAHAQGSIKVQAPNIVSADEQFNVAFVIEGEKAPSSFNWDPGNDFQLVWGPQKGTSTSISIVNGKSSRSSQTTYTYILQPKSTGKFTLPSAVASFKGGDVTSTPFTIEVLQGGRSSQPSGQAGGSGQSARSGQVASAGDIAAEDLFLRLSLSRREVVVGESVTAVLKLYQRVNIAGFEDTKFPSFNGFWSQEVQAPTNIDFKRENVGGEIYNSAVLRSWVIIPQQAGTINIDPAELVCLVNVRTQSSSRSIFDSFFDDGYRTIRKRVYSEGQSVRVSPLPGGAPASFGGGVGNFSIKASLSRDTVKTHEAASLNIVISGKGNVSLLEAPKVRFPLDFETYDTKVTDASDKSTGRTSGSKTFEYPFIPRSYGDFTIEPVEYTYYDVNAHKYVTLRTDPVPVHVLKGAETDVAASGGQMVQGFSKRDVKDLGSDIRFIHTKKPALGRSGVFLCASPWYWAAALLLAVAAAAFWLLQRRRASRLADVALTRHRRASGVARKRLAAAGDYLQRDLYTAFYEELHKALMGYVGDKLDIDLSEMSKDNIAARLVSLGVGEGMASELTGLLDACEYARYAPDAGHDAMQQHYDRALSVISEIDAAMKNKAKPKAGAAASAALLLMLMPGALHSQTPSAEAALADETAAASAPAADYPSTLWEKGVQAYADGDWGGAVAAWQSLSDLGIEAADLYYNLAGAYYKSSDLAHAILYYERTLRLDPSHKDAKFNLEYARNQTQDKIDSVPEFFLRTWARRVSYWMSSDSWAVLALVLLGVTLVLGLLFLLGRGKGERRAGFFGALAALALTLIAGGNALSQKRAYFRSDAAVVMRPVTSAKSSPGGGASATDLFILHEGTVVKVLDKVGDWYQMSLSDGRQGWIQAGDIEII